MLGERIPLVIFAGFEASGNPLDEQALLVATPRRRFDVTVSSGWWENHSESPEDAVQRARKVLVDTAERYQRPIGAVGLSANASLPIAASEGLGSDIVGGVAALHGPIQKPDDLSLADIKRFDAIEEEWPAFVTYLKYFGDTIAPRLSGEEIARILTIRGRRDHNVPPDLCVFPGAENKSTWTPLVPQVPFVREMPHMYNLGRALRSRRFKQFFTERLAI